MRRTTFILICRAGLALAICAHVVGNARAITASDLQKEISNGDKFTIIDVRIPEIYGRGHISGAINIPASLCAVEKLPPLGKVIVYDEGLGRRGIEAAAEALKAKPGITVDVLAGGYAAWESAHGGNSRGLGMKPQSPNYITYAQLKAADASDLALVDLRKAPSTKMLALQDDGNPDHQPLTDLAKEFPGFKQARSPFQGDGAGKSSAGQNSGAGPLMVLIDNGDGTAEKTARMLKNSGNHRYVILVGGEKIIARHGKAGLQRKTLTSFSRTNAPSAVVGPK